MILRSLRVENVRSYRDLFIEFAPGITTVLGPNGAGKSTLLQALAWALLGEKAGSPVSLRRHHAPFLRVTLEFQAHGKDYRVVRERRFDKGAMRSGASALYETTGGRERKVRWQERDITEEIIQITGLEPAVFLNAILVSQGEIDALTRATPAEREAVVSRLLGIEEMEKVWEQMGKVAGTLEGEAGGLRSALKVGETKERELAEARPRREEAARRAATLEGDAAALGRREVEARRGREEAEGRRREALRLREEMKHLDSEGRRREEEERRSGVRLHEVEQAAAEAARIAPALARLPRLEAWQEVVREEARLAEQEAHLRRQEARLDQARRRVEERAREREEWQALGPGVERLQRERDRLQPAAAVASRVEGDLQRTRERLRALEEEVEAARRKLPFDDPARLADLHRARVEEATAEQRKAEEAEAREAAGLARLEGEAKGAQKALAELEGASGPCPLCRQPLSDDHRGEVLEECRERLEGFGREAETRKRAREEARAQAETLRRRREEVLRLPVEAWARAARDAEGLRGEVTRLDAEAAAGAEAKRALAEAEAGLAEARGRRAALEPKAAEWHAATKVLEEARPDEAVKEALGDRRTALTARRSALLRELEGEPADPAGEIARLKQAEQRFHRLQGLIQEKEKAAEALERARRERGEAARRRSELDAQLAPLREAEPRALEASRRHDEAREGAAAAAVAAARAQEAARAEEQRIAALEAEVARLRESGERARELEGLLSFLGRLRNLLSREGLQKEMRARARPLLEKHASEMFSEFQLAYSGLRVTDDYGLLLVSPEVPDGLEAGAASGGERVAAALALRAAIARLLAGSRLELLILDEPTVHLDTIRRRELVPVLRSMGSIPQILVVTHDEELEAAADVIWRVRKEDGVSAVEVEAPGFETMASKMG